MEQLLALVIEFDQMVDLSQPAFRFFAQLLHAMARELALAQHPSK